MIEKYEKLNPKFIIDTLDPYISDRRKSKIEKVLAMRNLNLHIVLDGLVDSGNISAISRTAESFGIQNIHLVRTRGAAKFTPRSSQGAHKWLSRYFWNESSKCLLSLRHQGLKIIGTSLCDRAKVFQSVDFSKPCALIFGEEESGLQECSLSLCDEICYIPSNGFSQSLNVSVAAGILMNHAHTQSSHHCENLLSLKANYYLKSVQSHILRVLD